MAKQLPFITRIEQLYPSLSPNGRKIANYLQQQPIAILSNSVAEIALQTHTSKATVSRFFRQLGYESHQDVKLELRSLRESGYPLFTQYNDNNYIQQELQQVARGLESLDQQQLDNLVEAILYAPKICIIGFRNSFPVAMHLRQQLLQVRPGVNLLPHPGQSLGEEISQIEADTLVIMVGFRRRPKQFEPLLNALSTQCVTALITDPSGQLYANQVKHFVMCQLGQEMAMDSYACAMGLVSILANRVLSRLGTKGSERIKEVANHYKQLDELERN